MKFWDASAVVALLLGEGRGGAVAGMLQRDPNLVVWWGTATECLSAVCRAERDGRIPAPAAEFAIRRLRLLAENWVEVAPDDALRAAAGRLVRVHPLRAVEAFQLAAGLAARTVPGEALEFVSFDRRLSEAARKEGLTVIGPPGTAGVR